MRRLLVLYGSYGFVGEACYLTSLAERERLLSSDEAKGVSASIREWHREAHYRFSDSPAWERFIEGLQHLRRRVTSRFSAPKAARWAGR